MKPKAKTPLRQYVICVDNNGYAASLETRKLYVVERDEGANKRGLVRVVDESGEGYLYPKKMFRAISLPETVKKALGKSIKKLLRKSEAA
jgi:hypothetical protein